MNKKLMWKMLGLMLVLAVLVTACGGTTEPTKAPEPTKAGEAPKPTEPPAPAEVQDFVTWYQFDQENEDPANDEAVGNAYIRETIPVFNEVFEGKWNWVNVPKAWDRMESELVAVPVSILYDRGQTVFPSTLLHERIPEPFVIVHPETPGIQDVSDGTRLQIEITGDKYEAAVQLDETIPLGVVLVPRSMGIPVHEQTAVKISHFNEVAT